MKQKTILQHLNRLPECVRFDVKLEFIRQVVRLDRVCPYETLSFIVFFHITWGTSELGWNFYEALHDELHYHEQNNLKLPR